MRKIIIVLGTMLLLLSLGAQALAKDKLIYVCYLDKSQETRVVRDLKDCKTSEMAMALDRVEPNKARGDQDVSKRARKMAKKYPDSLNSMTFGSDTFLHNWVAGRSSSNL